MQKNVRFSFLDVVLLVSRSATSTDCIGSDSVYARTDGPADVASLLDPSELLPELREGCRLEAGRGVVQQPSTW